jgi:2-dehydropantoate 2-reductase
MHALGVQGLPAEPAAGGVAAGPPAPGLAPGPEVHDAASATTPNATTQIRLTTADLPAATIASQAYFSAPCADSVAWSFRERFTSPRRVSAQRRAAVSGSMPVIQAECMGAGVGWMTIHSGTAGRSQVRILVFGAGVIGSVYAVKLLQAGHEVVMLARGRRLSDLQAHGLVLEEAESGKRTVLAVPSVGELAPDDRYEVVLVPVRSGQLASTLPVLAAMNDGSDVLFFGNTAGYEAELLASLGERVLFGFPAAGGVRDGPVIKYVLIRQQKTMLGEPSGTMTPRVRHLQDELSGAGFPATISTRIDDWLLGHAAFIAPIAFALYRVDTDPARLAADPRILRSMVLAIRQAFTALRAAGNAEIPTNLRVLFLRLPTAFAVAYWRRVFAGPRGELWFGAHTRAAPDEMRSLAQELKKALRHTGHPTPDLDELLTNSI